MGPAVVLGALVALSLLGLGATLRRTGRSSPRRASPFRGAVPWVVGGVLLVGGALAAIPAVPPIVIGALMAYTGVAVTATWRMASLDRVSPWMPQSRRLARIGVAAVALTWLGLVLGLLLRIADLVARTPHSP
jgi:hypothetical protein